MKEKKQRSKGVQNIINQYFSFDGKISRLKYMGALFLLVISMAFIIISMTETASFLINDVIDMKATDIRISIAVFFLIVFAILASNWLVMFFSFMCRRLNDIGLRHYLCLIIFIPIINVLFLIMLFTLKGVEEDEVLLDENTENML